MSGIASARAPRYLWALGGFYRFLARDLTVGALTALLVVLDQQLHEDGGVLASAIGIAAGATVAISAFLVHEWGHLLATLGSGGHAHAPLSIASVFLFRFDVERSSRRQFLAMSCGGYAATALAVIPLAMWIDLHRLSGVVGLILSVLGIGATLILEIPTTWRVAWGAPLPTGGVYEGRPKA